MAKAVVGDGPIRLFTSKGGHVSLPLAGIAIAGDSVQAATTGLDSTKKAALEALVADGDAWLRYQVKQKHVREAPPGPAAIFTAAAAGSAGNRISLKITAAADKVDIEATMSDEYVGVTLATLQARLDAMPGLVKLKALADPKVAVVARKVTPTGATWDVNGEGDKSSFTLEPRRPEIEAAKVTLEVSSVQGTGVDKTFTLAVTWTAKVTNVTAETFAARCAPLAFAAAVTAPKGGYKLPRPLPDPIKLGGGADKVGDTPATSATAILIANE